MIVIPEVYTVCCAHHKCSHHLSPCDAITIPYSLCCAFHPCNLFISYLKACVSHSPYPIFFIPLTPSSLSTINLFCVFSALFLIFVYLFFFCLFCFVSWVLGFARFHISMKPYLALSATYFTYKPLKNEIVPFATTWMDPTFVLQPSH